MAKYSLYHIVAAAGNAAAGRGVIGRENSLPWPKNSADMKYFRAVTDGGTLIMGRRTFESIGAKPLPNRQNFVLSRSPLNAPEGVRVFASVNDALQNVATEKAFIIGGGEIFSQTIDRVDGIYLTLIEGEYPGDTFYPAIPGFFREKAEARKLLQENPRTEAVYYENTQRA